MAAPSRAAQFSHMQKVLKKHYKPTPINAGRSVLEHMLFACLAENAHYSVAEEAYATVVETYYDWNEVRVTTIRELSEVVPRLPNPPEAATRMRRVLQHVFENGYVFDLEYLRKQNLGPTVAELKKIDGVTPFIVSYVVQATLGGHAIPLDSGALQVLQILDFATEAEVKELAVAGLERAISKNQGVEFGSLLHELVASFIENPFAVAMKKILLEINPDAKGRLPKRGGKEKQEPDEKSTSQTTKKGTKETATVDSDEEPTAKKPTKKAPAKQAPAKPAPAKPAPAKPASAKPASAKPASAKQASEKKAAAKKAPAAKRKIVPTKKKVKVPVKKGTKKAAPEKVATKKVATKKVATKKAPVKKAPAKKAPAKKAPAKKVAKKETPAKKTTKKPATKAAPKKKNSKGTTKRKPR